jgi:hypothetical protein
MLSGIATLRAMALGSGFSSAGRWTDFVNGLDFESAIVN